MDDLILCPLVGRGITCVECMENRETKDESVPAEFKAKDEWRKECAACQYHDK